MKIQSILIILLLFIVSCQEITNQENNITATCKVSNKIAIFEIPITPQASYTWYKEKSHDDTLEYRSHVVVNQYAFGFSLYKVPGSEEQEGSINQLFREGQLSVWEEEGNTGSVLEGHNLTATYIEPYIVIKISDPSTLQLLFKDKPSSCAILLTSFAAPEFERIVEIIYE